MKKLFLNQFSRRIDTPQVVIFRSVLEDNIMKMGNIARENDLFLRPHVKTHKTPELASLQQELCSDVFRGVTCSKVDEAIVFAEHGFDDIFLAYPIISSHKAQRFLQKMELIEGRASTIVDSSQSFNIWNEVSDHLQYPIHLLIKIDVGLHRCGFDPHNETDEILSLISKILETHEYCNFSGLISHAGQAYGMETKEQVQSIAQEEQVIMSFLKEKIIDEFGILIQEDNIEISVGSTPTCLACDNYHENSVVTEIRPGNYVFCDRTPLRLGLIEQDDISMNILAEVVSENEWYYIIDCGSKTLSSDRGAQGSSGSKGYGILYNNDHLIVEKLSEEHGWVAKSEFEENNNLSIGDRVLVIPNHACAVSNLGDEFLVFDERKNESNMFESWSIDARGKRK